MSSHLVDYPASPKSQDLAAAILDHVRELEYEWVGLVTKLAVLESPTTHPETQGPVQAVVEGTLTELGFRVRRYRTPNSGGMLLARPDPGSILQGSKKQRPFQLLIGHTDTVWPLGTLHTMPVEREGNIFKGPGVFDMKGGVAQMILALRALHDLELQPAVQPVVFLNSDEEVGSHDSTPSIRRLARRACRAFVMEPALGLEGRVKTARKGTGKFSIRVLGRSAHAGLDPEKGASAIQELALVIQTLHGFTDLSRGIVVNVGEITGGVRPNVVAAEARAEVDVRVSSVKDGEELTQRIHAIESQVPGCTVEIRGSVDRPPLERTPGNQILWRSAQALGRQMSMELEEGSAGGASDGNTTSLTTPTLDGLGMVGDGAHAVHEHFLIDRSLERCALLAALLLLPPQP
ncbi:MAG: M20 family metallopeptidase [Gemmatimonadota bacterium]